MVVPVMMQRILQLPEETLDKYDLAEPARDRRQRLGAARASWRRSGWTSFGDNLYNLYGSTEVAWATIATPEDLRAAPGTAGKPPRGHRRQDRRRGGRGRGAARARRAASSSATRWRSRATRAAAARTSTRACCRPATSATSTTTGRLFIDGRDDEMIVSGGENVFPREVEDLLAGHDAVKEVAVIGVDDDEFGQRLKAFVVTDDGEELDEDEVQGLREVEPRRLQGPARRRVPRLAAAQRDRQGPQARAGRRSRPLEAVSPAIRPGSAARARRAERRTQARSSTRRTRRLSGHVRAPRPAAGPMPGAIERTRPGARSEDRSSSDEAARSAGRRQGRRQRGQLARAEAASGPTRPGSRNEERSRGSSAVGMRSRCTASAAGPRRAAPRLQIGELAARQVAAPADRIDASCSPRRADGPRPMDGRSTARSPPRLRRPPRADTAPARTRPSRPSSGSSCAQPRRARARRGGAPPRRAGARARPGA